MSVMAYLKKVFCRPTPPVLSTEPRRVKLTLCDARLIAETIGGNLSSIGSLHALKQIPISIDEALEIVKVLTYQMPRDLQCNCEPIDFWLSPVEIYHLSKFRVWMEEILATENERADKRGIFGVVQKDQIEEVYKRLERIRQALAPPR